MDLARAFHRLTLPAQEGGGGLKAKDLARRLGKSEAFISEHKALLQLGAEDQQRLEAGTLSFDEARSQLRTRTTRPGTGQAGRAERGQAALAPGTGGPGGDIPGSDDKIQDTCEMPARLDNGYYVYAEYVGHQPTTKLSILVTGPLKTAPAIDTVVRAVQRHFQFLKLKQYRESRDGKC
jgi:hypothetical protein